MNCRDTESLLLAERDGVLTKAQHAELAEHIATCAHCRQLRTALTEAALYLKAETANVRLPDIETEWHSVQTQIAPPRRVSSKPKRRTRGPLAPVIWFGAPLAAAAALVVALINPFQDPASRNGDRFEGDDASTMVYVDQESGWLVVWASDANNHG